jgi:eukaryotic-like serine/threonine-protein kinase
MIAAMPDESPEDPLLGRVLADKLRVDELIGRGSMGVVYRARHLTLKRDVAVKIMRVHAQTDPKYAKRFKREAETAFKLDHPNVLRVLDFGQEADGLLYMAMEFVDGKNLLETLAEDFPLTSERVSNIVSQILAGVAAAHDAGVVHRDLKPENVMLVHAKDDDGADVEVVRVCDFGVARLIDDEPDEGVPSLGSMQRSTSSWTTTLTKHGMTVGTPNYMAPEQALGQRADGRTDVYAVGAILFQLLTNRIPFDGATPLQVMLKQIESPAPRPSSIVANVDAHLERICLKALRKKPDARYQTARDMRARLRAMSEESVTIEVASQRMRDSSTERRKRRAPTVRPTADEVSSRRRSSSKTSTTSKRGDGRRSLVGIAAVVVALIVVVCATWGARWLAAHP